MASRYPSNSNTQPSTDAVRLPPLKSLKLQYRSPHDTPGDYYEVPTECYPTPTPTSAPAYVHRQSFAFQHHHHPHDNDTWQQQHPHGPTSAHSQTPSQVHPLARSTPIVPTTVDPPQRTPSAYPKHRSTYPLASPYTSSYNPPYPPSSTTTSTPYVPYNTSANTTSPTFSPSTSPSYSSAPPNAPPSYPSQHPYPTPTSAYPHPPPSPTPTPTQPHTHPHPSPHYVHPPASASTYPFDDTRSNTAYEGQTPVRPHPDTRDSRVPIPDRPRYPPAQPKPADTRIDSRHEMYPQHPPVHPSAPVEARKPQSYPQPETRAPYAHQGDSSRPGTSYTQGQPPAHVQPQAQPEVARSYPPEQRATAYTQDTKHPYPPPEPATRTPTGYTQDPPSRVSYPSEASSRPALPQDSRAGYHQQDFHASNRGTGPPHVAEPRPSSGYVAAQDTRHGYASEASAMQSSYLPAEQRQGPPAPPHYIPGNTGQRSSFGDSRPVGAYQVSNSDASRSSYTAPDSVSVPVIVPSQRPPPPPPPPLQQQLTRQSVPSHSYSSYPPTYTGSPASTSQHASTATTPHTQPQSYIQPQQAAPHPTHSTHGSQPPHGPQAAHPPNQTIPSGHPTHAQMQSSQSIPHAQTPQQPLHHHEAARPAFVSPAETMHAREMRFPVSTITEEDREREREKERERDREKEREREREQREQREREREQRERERESQREREKKERERLAELREKEQRERERDREREGVMHEVLKHCTVLYNFATRYAQLQSSTPLAQPSPEELAEMTHRAQEVVRLLESLRSPSSGKLANASASSTLVPSAPHSSITSSAFGDRTNPHPGPSGGTAIDLDARAPKRPWEETQSSSTLPHVSQLHLSNSPIGAGQGGQTAAERSAAEKDMEIIRSKRALTTSLAAAAAAAGGTGSVAGAVGGAVGSGKNKYRKRSRATPPGKCHSCNIRETPEWRRGPDGARTLCNACGLHYAKLVRKRDKALAAEGGSGTVMRIDMDMLRASARAAESEKAARAAVHGGSSSASGSGTTVDGDMDNLKMNAHTSSFQIVPVPMTMSVDEGAAGPSQTQTQQTQGQTAQQGQGQAGQNQMQAPVTGTAGTHGHPHGQHPVPSPHGHGQGHYSQHARTQGRAPPPPWAGKAYGQEMQHPQQSFMRTSHSVSSGASPP